MFILNYNPAITEALKNADGKQVRLCAFNQLGPMFEVVGKLCDQGKDYWCVSTDKGNFHFYEDAICKIYPKENENINLSIVLR